MQKVVHDLKVIRKKRLNPFNFVLELKSITGELPEVLPGQFAEVLVENSKNTFLRRPFSIHDVDDEEQTISLFIKIVGEGSRRLSWLEEGDFLNVLFPLGNPFSMPEDDKTLLIGGGCGIAPLLFLSKFLHNEGLVPTVMIGGRTEEDILLVDEFKKYGELHIATEDGSVGEKGLVTNHSLFNDIASYSKIYTCGPDPMMKAIAKIASQNDVDCEVSLENTMACGIGACLCCVTETTTGNQCVCTEGPVFNSKDLKW